MVFLPLAADAKTVLFPRWMMHALRVLSRTPSIPISPAGTGVQMWLEFLECSSMKKILRAVRACQLPHALDDWERPLRSATRLFKQLEEEGLADLNSVYPTMCLLIKGRHCINESGKKGRRRLFTEDPNVELVHASASTDCPVGFMERLLKDQRKQMSLRVNGMTPLHVILEKTYVPSEMLKVMLKAAPECASMPYKKEFPFHQACRNGYLWDTGLKELFQAYPDVLHAADIPPLYLVAFVFATNKHDEERRRFLNYHSYYHGRCFFLHQEQETLTLDTFFEILTKDPTIVQNMKVVNSHKFYFSYR